MQRITVNVIGLGIYLNQVKIEIETESLYKSTTKILVADYFHGCFCCFHATILLINSDILVNAKSKTSMEIAILAANNKPKKQETDTNKLEQCCHAEALKSDFNLDFGNNHTLKIMI